ncbi:MAG: FAD-binding oxidoreductase [Elainella sp. Prado103]|jgi:glycine/D-amino acid oxidase-like deaminating enzyme|nr:FAD-binding oxidoreductase [Elainella sp. Prado103]
MQATTYDWLVIGNGIAGAALSYELQKQGFSVLILEQSAHPQNATRYSYGGIASWSGTTDLTRLLCHEGITLHRQLGVELEADTQFRELDLLLTVAPDRDPAAVAATYDAVEILPMVLEAAEAVEREPRLNRSAIAGALRFPHGHVQPEACVAAYNQAFLRLGGTIQIAPAINWVQKTDRLSAVITPTSTYEAAQIAICTGAMTRSIVKTAGIRLPIYFTQAEILETPALDWRLQSLIMPAEMQRFALEAKASGAELAPLWDQAEQEVLPAILDPGVVQFLDGRMRIGQVSRVWSDLQPAVDAAASEAALRDAIGQLLPDLQTVPGQWHRCQVAFSGDRLPLIGQVPGWEGLHVFVGFSNPFAILPPLARRFAAAMSTPDATDWVLQALSPQRFGSA